MYVVFFSTSDVFEAEERLNKESIECKVVPTPVTDKAYCGVCLKVVETVDLSVLDDLDYERVEG